MGHCYPNCVLGKLQFFSPLIHCFQNEEQLKNLQSFNFFVMQNLQSCTVLPQSESPRPSQMSTRTYTAKHVVISEARFQVLSLKCFGEKQNELQGRYFLPLPQINNQQAKDNSLSSLISLFCFRSLFINDARFQIQELLQYMMVSPTGYLNKKKSLLFRHCFTKEICLIFHQFSAYFIKLPLA